MAIELPSLGELEARVLRLVWQHQPCTERKISDVIQQEHTVGRTTVLKTMQRLEGKGLLARLKGDRPIRYCAVLDEEHVLPRLVRRFVDRVLGGYADPLVAYLADSDKLSTRDVETLRKIARKIAKESDKQT